MSEPGTPPEDARPVTPDNLAEGPCAAEERIAEERCALADRLRGRLEMARGELREAQRAFDVHQQRMDRAIATSDARAVRHAKDEAQAAFRVARSRAASRADLEAAATTWLREIDRINAAVRKARAQLDRERRDLGRLVTELERLTVAADAARIAAERATEACVEARERLAACVETREHGAAVPGLAAQGTQPAVVAEAGKGELERELGSGVEPQILAILRGDAGARVRVATTLGGDDAAEVALWAERLERLVDAIVERTIEESRFVFPRDHAFWGAFSQHDCRDIAVALAALGYRPDAKGAFVDARVPSRRDLSLAVGYAGHDPMRIRRWPTDAEMTALFEKTVMDVGEFLAAGAGGLTLGEMVALLGRRAEAMTDLWNAWGRVRPLLLRGTS